MKKKQTLVRTSNVFFFGRRSTGVGRYLEGGELSGAQLVDQRFCPRIVEGEVRVLTSGPTCLQLIHRKAGKGGAFPQYKPDEPKYAELTRKLISEDVPRVMATLGLAGEPLPALWSIDLIPYSDEAGRDQ